jgi:hypothetical protein
MAEVRELLKTAKDAPTAYARLAVEQMAAGLLDPAFTPEGQRHSVMLEYTYQLAAGLIGGCNTLADAQVLRDAYTESCRPYSVGSDFDSALYGALCKIERSPDAETSKFRAQRASDTVIRKAEWLWEGKLPMNDFSLLAGREGVGKSTLTHWISAQISKGTLPGDLRGTPKGVLYVSTEDSWDVKTVPCLAAAGADLTRVYHVEMSARNWITDVVLPADLGALSILAAETDAALIIFDPLADKLAAGLDTHKDSDVKRALGPLLGFAQMARVAVLGLAHVNKGKDIDPSTSIMGSRAFVASPRSVLFAANTEVGYGLSVVKSNYGPANESTDLYSLEKVTVNDAGITGMTVAWQGITPETISELAKPSKDRQDSRDWLRTYLRDGPKMKSDVIQAARTAGFAPQTMNLAITQVGHSARNGGRLAEWSL